MKTVLITGASGGIGSSTALLFAKNGYSVIAHYNKGEDGINFLKTEFENLGLANNLFVLQADFSRAEEIKKACETIDKNYKKIDVLVNNAGLDYFGLVTDTAEKTYDDIFSVNMKSAFFLTNAVLKKMISFKSGKIVNVSSIWGVSGGSCEVAYSASKSALIGYTKALAKEVAPSNISVNCVCPGVIDTAMNSRLSAEELADIKDSTPLGRLGKPEEIAELILFLSSNKADFITGQIITVDGGFIL